VNRRGARGAAGVYDAAMSLVQGSPSLRLSELLGVMSFGVDLGMGQPMEHVLRQSMLALGMADRLGLDSEEREAVYFGSLLAWVGCHIDAYEQAKWFGDDTVLKGDWRQIDFAKASAGPLFMARHLGGGRSLPERIAMVPGFFGEGRRAGEDLLENHWRASDDLMERIGLDQLVRDTVEQSFERWDGRGVPKGVSGSQILVTSQLISLADVVDVFYRAGGVEAAISVARERAGTQFDPELVDTFAGGAEALFAELDAVEPWDAVTEAEHASRYLLAHERLDLALEAVADFVDVKSPFTIGHSRGVATLAADAAGHYGLGERDTDALRRAALVHDLGRLGVPNTIWDKPGPLGPAELEKARMHVYLTERMLAASPALSPLAAIASQHHERLDGSGYPRGLTGGDITPAGRILAAADSYHARLEPRPHRPAMSAERAAAELREDVRAGRIDADAAAAVLAAAGHRATKKREWPAGLTDREVDVLRLLARGMSNKEIAAELVISPKTAGTHLEHIYAKLGVGNRALAGLFAARHGLISPED
jgi:HD-GYP domain-containing protein (c-di-GMP phosphodiesterase class II)/DNA-binding CsgD family transcriptional regulator